MLGQGKFFALIAIEDRIESTVKEGSTVADQILIGPEEQDLRHH